MGTALLPLLLPLLAVLALRAARARADPPPAPFRATFPIEIMLKDSNTQQLLDRPVAIVAGLDTTMYVASASGQIMLVDVKTGAAAILNRGGDDQPFGGLCLDSRGPGTLYATGRHTGAVFAFNRRGELLRKYQLTTVREKGGTAFLTACIQTRYQLLVVDSNNDRFHYLPLADDGPLRGRPPPLADTVFQGERVQYDGAAYVHRNGAINAYGVEWTQKFNETAYVVNSATGHIFTFTVKRNSVIPLMRKVDVVGRVTTFVGALGILFDSTNENVMYLTMPHLNAIAVLEFSRKHAREAKFIRYLKSALTTGPIAVGEFGNWLYPISGRFDGASAASAYSIVQVPRHEQIIDDAASGVDDDQFTTVLDDDDEYAPPPVVIDAADIEQQIRADPPPVGTSAPEAISPAAAAEAAEESESASLGLDAVWGDAGDADDAGDAGDASAESARETPGATPVAAAEAAAEAAGAGDAAEPDGAPSTFGAAAEEESAAAAAGRSDGRACFPADATVSLQDGSTVRMDALRVGDRVLVGRDGAGAAVFSAVFMFSHRERGAARRFVNIAASHGQTLALSGGHLLYVRGRLVAAASVRAGHVLHAGANGTIAAVRVWTGARRGLYNPQTLHGDIVVNGVAVSTYTTAVRPVAAKALMAPVRAAFAWRTVWAQRISAVLCAALDGGA